MESNYVNQSDERDNYISTDADNTSVFCVKCGNKMKVSDTFCSKCGNKIISDENIINKTNNSIQKLAKLAEFMGILSVFLLIIAVGISVSERNIGYGYYRFLKLILIIFGVLGVVYMYTTRRVINIYTIMYSSIIILFMGFWKIQKETWVYIDYIVTMVIIGIGFKPFQQTTTKNKKPVWWIILNAIISLFLPFITLVYWAICRFRNKTDEVRILTRILLICFVIFFASGFFYE